MSHSRRITALVFSVAVGVVMLSGPASAVTVGASQANVAVKVAPQIPGDRCC